MTIDTWDPCLSPSLTNSVVFYLLHPVYVSWGPPSLALVRSCSPPFIPHCHILSRLLLLPGHTDISIWMTGMVVVMIPKKEPRTDCVFLLISRINYCIPLMALSEIGRKEDHRQVHRLPVIKVREESVLGQREASWLNQRNRFPVTIILDAWLSCFLWLLFLIPITQMSRLCLSDI